MAIISIQTRPVTNLLIFIVFLCRLLTHLNYIIDLSIQALTF